MGVVKPLFEMHFLCVGKVLLLGGSGGGGSVRILALDLVQAVKFFSRYALVDHLME